MKKLAFLLIISAILCPQAMAYLNTNFHVPFKALHGWDFDLSDHEEHTGRIERIVLKDLNRQPADNVSEKLFQYGQDIASHFYLGDDSKCYMGRPLAIKANIYGIKETSTKTKKKKRKFKKRETIVPMDESDKICGVMLVSDWDEEISPEIKEGWARSLATIALELNFPYLELGENIEVQENASTGSLDVLEQTIPLYKQWIINRANMYIAVGVYTLDGDFYIP